RGTPRRQTHPLGRWSGAPARRRAGAPRTRRKGRCPVAGRRVWQATLLRPPVCAAPHIPGTFWLIGLLCGLAVGPGLWFWFGPCAPLRFLAGLAVVLGAERGFIAVIIRRIGSEKHSLADILTLSRGVSSAALAGLVLSGAADRVGPAQWIAWLL